MNNNNKGEKMKVVTAHELANKLLAMKDKPIEIITRVDGQYVQTKYLGSLEAIWDFWGGSIRIQPNVEDIPVKATDE